MCYFNLFTCLMWYSVFLKNHLFLIPVNFKTQNSKYPAHNSFSLRQYFQLKSLSSPGHIIFTICQKNFSILQLLAFLIRSCSDTVFCHLAATDIMASLDAIFAFGLLLSDRTFFDFYFIDDIICQFTGITWCVVSVATPLLLSIVSIGRFLALYAPHRYDLIYTPNLVQILIVISWTIRWVSY